MRKMGILIVCASVFILAAAGAAMAKSAVVVAGNSVSTENAGPGTEQMEPSLQAEAVLVWGAVTGRENGALLVDNKSDQFSQGPVVIYTSEETKILDAQNGWPASLESIQPGDTVCAYIGEAMTMSLPPCVNAEVIFSRPSEQGNVPAYVRVNKIETAGDGSARIKTAGGVLYTLPADCEIRPYKTRNIVTLRDIAEGSRMVIWADENHRAEKLVLFIPAV